MRTAEALAVIKAHFASAMDRFGSVEEPTEEDIRRIKAAIADAMSTCPEPVIGVTYDPETRTVNVTLPAYVDTVPVTYGYTEQS
jgi:hypothetical protein